MCDQLLLSCLPSVSTTTTLALIQLDAAVTVKVMSGKVGKWLCMS